MKLALTQRIPRLYDQQALSAIVQQLQDQINNLTEGRAAAYHGALVAAPGSGTWVKGDWVKNSAPASAGYFGFVCTVSGTPGTWKGFGLIA